MLKRSFVILSSVLLSATVLFGHGDPIVGTVTDVKSDTVTIKDKDNKAVVIMLMKDTKYLMNKKAVTKADLKVGARVSIHAEMDPKMKMYNAEEIEIGAAAAATTTPATPAPKPATPSTPSKSITGTAGTKTKTQ